MWGIGDGKVPQTGRHGQSRRPCRSSQYEWYDIRVGGRYYMHLRVTLGSTCTGSLVSCQVYDGTGKTGRTM